MHAVTVTDERTASWLPQRNEKPVNANAIKPRLPRAPRNNGPIDIASLFSRTRDGAMVQSERVHGNVSASCADTVTVTSRRRRGVNRARSTGPQQDVPKGRLFRRRCPFPQRDDLLDHRPIFLRGPGAVQGKRHVTDNLSFTSDTASATGADERSVRRGRRLARHSWSSHQPPRLCRW